MDKFVVLTSKRYWGKGDTLKEALKNAGNFPAEVIIYRYPSHLVDPDSIRVDEMGGIRWTWTEEGSKVKDVIGVDIFKLGNFDCTKRLTLSPTK